MHWPLAARHGGLFLAAAFADDHPGGRIVGVFVDYFGLGKELSRAFVD
jgi:hypothetical protein